MGTNGRAFAVATASSSPISGTIYSAVSWPGSGKRPFSVWYDVSPVVGSQALAFLDVTTFDGRYVIVVGYAGLIYRSQNAGVSWTSAVSGSTGDLYAVSSGSPLVAMAGGTYGTLLKTKDGGKTWLSLAPALARLGE